MKLFLTVIVVFLFGATPILAADCIIVGNETYRISDCVNIQSSVAIQKFLGSNYAIITDRKDGKILAVFLAEIGDNIQNQISQTDSSVNSDASDPQIPMQPPEERRSIDFLDPVPLSSADQVVDEQRSSGNILKTLTIRVGQFHRSYEINNSEKVTDVFEREKQNLLEFLEDQQRAVAEFVPLEYHSDSMQVIQESRNALINDDVFLESMLLLK